MQIQLILFVVKWLSIIALIGIVSYKAYNGIFDRGVMSERILFDKFKQDMKIVSDAVVINALKREQQITSELDSVKQSIEVKDDESKKLSAELSTTAKQLLNAKLQHRTSSTTNGNCGRVPQSSTSAEGSDTTGTERTWLVSETNGNRLIERHVIADSINDAYKACRTYLMSLEGICYNKLTPTNGIEK